MERREGKYPIANWLILFLLLSLGHPTLSKPVSADCTSYTPQASNSFGFYWGTVTIQGEAVQIGDVIRAYVDTVGVNGGCVGIFTVKASGYYGALAIYEDDDTTPEKDGVEVGDTIHFAICHNGAEYKCSETAIWDSAYIMNPVRFNLTAGLAPTADFNATSNSVCKGYEINFTDESTNNPTFWEWDLGDGSLSQEQNPSHTYSIAGSYTVVLTAANKTGSDSKATEITVLDQPTSNFAADIIEGCAPLEVQFINNSTNATGFSWDFGDGVMGDELQPIHTYETQGNYTVTLTATNECGNSVKENADYIIVRSMPTADFTIDTTEGCAPLEVQFTNNSINAATLIWDFGDNSPASQELSPSHMYMTVGVYTITLTASTDCGDILRSKTILVDSKPIANFTATPIIGPGLLNMQFLDNSTKDAISWSWDFGDGSTSQLQDPNHSYYEPGVYTVIMTISNGNCGSAKKSQTIRVLGANTLMGKVLELQDPNQPELGGDPNKPISNATVIAFMENEDFYSRQAQTDPNGAYSIYLTQEGDYTLIAVAKEYFPVIESNDESGYSIGPNMSGKECNFNLRAKPKGPKVQISSFEWIENPHSSSEYSQTMILVFVDSNTSFDDLEVSIEKVNDSANGIIGPIEKDPNSVIIGGRSIGPHFQALYSDTYEESSQIVSLKIAVTDQNGTTILPYSFTFNPNFTIIGRTVEYITPAEGGRTSEVGLVNINGDGHYDNYDGSYVSIPPCSIVIHDGDPNFILSTIALRMERLAIQEYNAITATYNVELVDQHGDKITYFQIDKYHPFTIYLHFSLDSSFGNLAHLVIKYQDSDGVWKTDGISNIYVEDQAILFTVSHLTQFAAFIEDITPAHLTARVNTSMQIDLEWEDLSINKLYYEIWRCEDCADPQQVTNYELIATVDPNVTSYSDSNCLLGNTYYYQVRAVNEFGTNDYSNMAAKTINKCDFPPKAPSHLTANVLSDNEIVLSWIDNSTCETGFTILRRREYGEEIIRIDIPASIGTGTVIYTDTRLDSQTKYYYKVKATSAIGDSEPTSEVGETDDKKEEGNKGSGCFLSSIAHSAFEFFAKDVSFLRRLW
ncbi:MAG: PKD domain-containing protein [bacterium]